MEALPQPRAGIRKLYSCPECGRNFKRNSHLVRHKRLHTGEKPYQCLDCGKSFRQSTDVNTHRRIHTGETPYQCDQCGKSFRYRPSLLKHLKCHDEEKLYNCLECGKSFSPSLLSDAACQNSCVQRKPYRCPDCDENVQEISNLVVHLTVPAARESYVCPDCGKGFSCSFQLIKHRSLQSRFSIPDPNSLCSLDQSQGSLPSDPQDVEERESICEACDDLVGEEYEEKDPQQRMVLPARSYRTLLGRFHGLDSQKPKAHKGKPKRGKWQWKHPEMEDDESADKEGADLPACGRLLSSERKHLCCMCGKQFRYESQLVSHERIHTGEKPFECSICKKSFRERSDLCKHQKIHSESRPYRCLECGRTFLHQLAFVRHQRCHPKKKDCEDSCVYVAVLPSYKVDAEMNIGGEVQPPETLSFNFKQKAKDGSLAINFSWKLLICDRRGEIGNALEVLNNVIRRDKEIIGLKLKGEEYKLLAFADDIAFIMEQPKEVAVKLKERIQEYGQVAGLKINVNKTKILTKNMDVKQRENLYQATGFQIVDKVKTQFDLHE
ncbi:PREDICTED: zinc finger protein 331-like [Gekko japonicus]|uniref:Zinc finger protein 331-like n=1 Tax=Gekko japonicus TaxID=146911 RepID=A0ABM1K8J4_GEKJA|nr:PREDICTED: zinc finger protein 331-like [Gekko japonicus]